MPKSPRSRLAPHKQLSLGAAMIPNKLYFRIGEVSHLTEVKPYVLRYWEGQFPMLKPVKSRSGQRLYRRQDVYTIFEIKRLLQERRFTIDGARKQLAQLRPGQLGGETADSGPQTPQPATPLDAQLLRSIKHELRAVLTILSSKC
ncbi:MAG: MerR family transcriptional regulator [Terriglobia bacterium]|jgi:DNA-binding transcriptional MerR regulator